MAQLDRFIKVMLDVPDAMFLLSSNAPPRLSVNGREKELIARTIVTSQVRFLLQELLPKGVLAILEERGSADFNYKPEGLDAVQATILAWSGETSAIFRRPGAAVYGDIAAAHDQSRAAAAPGSVRGQRVAAPASAPASAASAPASAPASTRLPEITLPDESAPASSRRDIAGAPASSRGQQRDAHAIDALFRQMVTMGSSDLHLSTGEIPMVRKDGEMHHLKGHARLSNDSIRQLLTPIMPERNRLQFEATRDTDFAYEIAGLSRFRCNVFKDRNGMGAVFRTIPTRIVTAEELQLSQAIQNLCYLSKGLVLVTGPTGSGKSTTLAAMVDLVNTKRHDHIITIEDPVEFVHMNKSCLINQRQVGEDTDSFKQALRAALREDPDIVLVGEMRDLETVAIAIETAETGHLVFGTLHTSTAYSTIDRIIDQFPSDRQSQIRVMLSESLKGVISQTLCRKIGGGRVAAMEVLIGTAAVANLIREGKTFQIPSIMQTSRKFGMQLMNDSLFDLVQAKKVEVKEAYTKAIDKVNLATMLKAAGHSLDFLGGVGG